MSKYLCMQNSTLSAGCEHAQNWKIQCRMAFRTRDSNQCFVMAAILEFKMAATRFVRHFKLIHCWTQHVKILLFTKFQCHRSFGTQDSNVQRFVMAAILEFKMAADPLVRPLGSDNFWTQHVKIPLYEKFHTFCRMWTSRPIFVTYLPHWVTWPDYTNLGSIFIPRLIHDMAYMSKKLKDYSFSLSQDMKEDLKRKIWVGHSRSLAMSSLITSYSSFKENVRLPCTTEIKWVICKKLLPSHMHIPPQWSDPRRISPRPLA